MSKRVSRNLFLLGIVILAGVMAWALWQAPANWRPYIVIVWLVVLPLLWFVAHILDRVREIREVEAKTKRSQPQAPKPRPEKRRGPRSSYRVRHVSERRQNRQRML